MPFPATETSTKCLQIRYLQSAVSADDFPQHGATPTPRSNATSAGWKKERVERHSPLVWTTGAQAPSNTLVLQV